MLILFKVCNYIIFLYFIINFMIKGNEEEIIIVSIVRSQAIGFLKSLRRTNVMLTRCKKAMYIVTNKLFLTSGSGRNSLVGNLAENLGEEGWITINEVEKSLNM